MSASARRTGDKLRALNSFATLGLVLLALLGVSCRGCGCKPSAFLAKDAPRPNVVMIVVDDLGWADVGFHDSRAKTPNLDALAASGVEMTQFYVNALCTQTRAAFLTGRYSFRYGLQEGVILLSDKHGLPVEERTLAQGLKEAGYGTYLIGKWHLGHGSPEQLPTSRGFDHHYGNYCAGGDYFTRELEGVHDWHRDREPAFDEGYTTELITAEAVSTIRAHDPASGPLFLQLAYTAPHIPLQATPDSMEAFLDEPDPKRRAYKAMMAELDAGVGQVLAALDEKGMREDTLVVFFSDNGGGPEDGADNTPLRGGKGSEGYYEGSLRVPTIFSWPGALPAGQKVTAMAHAVDLYPTILGLAGASLDQELPIDGLDIWPVLTGQEEGEADREIPMVLSRYRDVLRQGDWKLVHVIPPHLYQDAEETAGAGKASGKASKSKGGKATGKAGKSDSKTGKSGGKAGKSDSKSGGKAGKSKTGKGSPAADPDNVEEGPSERMELYNIAQDPEEKNDLAQSEPDRLQEMVERVDWWESQAVKAQIEPRTNPGRTVTPDDFVYPRYTGDFTSTAEGGGAPEGEQAP